MQRHSIIQLSNLFEFLLNHETKRNISLRSSTKTEQAGRGRT